MFTSTLTGCPKNKKPAAAESSGSRDSGSAKTESMSPNHGQINGKSENANSSDLRVPESKLFLPFLVGAPKLVEFLFVVVFLILNFFSSKSVHKRWWI